MSTDNNHDRWQAGNTIEDSEYERAPVGVFCATFDNGWVAKSEDHKWVDNLGDEYTNRDLDSHRKIIPRPADAPAYIPVYAPQAQPAAFVPVVGAKPQSAADFAACPVGTRVRFGEEDDSWEKIGTASNCWKSTLANTPDASDKFLAACRDLGVRIISMPATGVTDKNAGRKDDAGKNRLDLLPPHALWEIGQALTFGAKKYGDENWRKVADAKARYTAALFRHIVKWMCGERNDADSGLHHLAHAGACVLFLLDVEVKS